MTFGAGARWLGTCCQTCAAVEMAFAGRFGHPEMYQDGWVQKVSARLTLCARDRATAPRANVMGDATFFAKRVAWFRAMLSHIMECCRC